MKDFLDFTEHDIRGTDWIGVVTNTNDTTFSGRCQINVFGIFDNVNIEHLPWAVPINSTIFANNGAGSLSIPKMGQLVRVQFNNGNIYAPEYTSIQNVDQELINKIKEDYQGTHVLLHDPLEELTLIYQKKAGFQIFFKGSFFQITPDSMVTIQTPNTESIIQLDGDITRIATKNEIEITSAAKVTVTADEVQVNGNAATKVGPGPYNRAVLAEPMLALLSVLATALDGKLPATPGVNVALVEAAKQSATSTNVMISI